MGGWQVAGGRPSWGAAGWRSKPRGPVLQRRKLLSGPWYLLGGHCYWGFRGGVRTRPKQWSKGWGGDQRSLDKEEHHQGGGLTAAHMGPGTVSPRWLLTCFSPTPP